MDTSGLQARIFSNVQGPNGMLGLEIPHHSYNRHSAGAGGGTSAPQMVTFSGDPNPQTQLSIKHSYPHAPHHSAASDDDDEAGGSANDGTGNDAKRKASQWHRMKWTDTMVKLLIMAVYYIGDEAGVAPTTTSSDGPEGRKNGKASCSAAAAAGLQQKKGKWKSVSRAMMEKGYCVSPQQCEDKFNDLNKRYKRVNDILGRGTACRVVENQSLLESMDLSPKLKEEARKLLNSKHLFFREMCAYHNSCASATHHHHHSPESASEKQNPNPNHRNPAAPAHAGHQFDGEGDDDEEEEEEEEYSEEDWEAEEGGGETGEMRKKARVQEIKGEVLGVMGDMSKTTSEKRIWMMGRLVELEEEGVKYQAEALEIEKQRWKWARYCRKKELEMEKKKVMNERMRLENQRMTLLLRQKELEFL